MWITKLQLSNIKSYGPDSPAIFFRPGVNLIQGSNGAGKSTILEAIGLALFDSRAYNLGQFVREGEKSGKITVGFMSAQDEREYEVVRYVGGSSQSYVYDPEVKRKLCEGREDTLVFIRQHLNLDAETDLTTLFEDAVGVPQGTMTAAFRERPLQRKQKFNRLLHIDMYEQAWSGLLQTGNYIRDLMAENASAQSELRGMLRDRPAVEAGIAAQAGEAAAAEAALEQVQADLSAVAAAVDSADALKDQLDELAGRITASQGALTRAELRLEQAQKAHAEALNAVSVVKEAAADYEAYELAQERLAAAEEERRTRDRLQDGLHDLYTRAQVVEQKRERIQQDLQAVAEAEAQLAQLEPLTARQAELELALAEAQQAGQEHGRLAAQLARQRDRLAQQGERLDAALGMAGAAVDAAEALPEPDSTLSLDELVDRATEFFGDLQRSLERWQAAQADAQKARQALDAVQDGVARRAAFERDLHAVLERRRELETQVGDCRQSLGQAGRELQALAEHEALLSTTGAICPVCRQPVDTHAQAEAQAHYSTERERLAALRADYEVALAGWEDRLQAVESERAALEAELTALPPATGLGEAQRRVDDTAAVLEERARLLQAAVRESRAAYAAGGAGLAREDERLADLARRAAGRESIRAELDALGDPRTSQTRARLTADRRADLTHGLEAAEAELETIAAQQRDLEGQAAQYAGLDDRLEVLRQQLGESAAGHTRYLEHHGLARQADARLGDAQACEADLAAHTEALAALQAEREGLETGYNADQHEADRAARRQLEDERLRLETSLDAMRASLAGLQARLAAMDEHARTLDSAEAAAHQLEKRQAVFEFVRQTVRDAGPRITRQLVQIISEQANHIFGDLLGDHSYILSWSDDYAITVNRRGEVRDFELLSGGEQMIAAMAVRLALLTQLANVRFAFFDEPTTNLDDTRRAQLAASLATIHSLRQLFVISHDDTFEQESYHVIQVYKEQDMSQVEML